MHNDDHFCYVALSDRHLKSLTKINKIFLFSTDCLVYCVVKKIKINFIFPQLFAEMLQFKNSVRYKYEKKAQSRPMGERPIFLHVYPYFL